MVTVVFSPHTIHLYLKKINNNNNKVKNFSVIFVVLNPTGPF